MLPGTFRKLWSGAAALGVTSALVVGVPAANASHSGSGAMLTASNGTKAITFSNGTTLTLTQTVRDAAWAPDGSRAVVLHGDADLQTVRFDDGDAAPLATPDPGVERAHPTWSNGGSTVVWAERASRTAPWQLMQSPSAFNHFAELISPDDGMNYTNPDGGPNGLVVFQRQANSGGVPTGPAEVWVYDPAGGDTPQTRIRRVVTDGRFPSISPDGTRVAFVRPGAAPDSSLQTWVSDLNGDNLVQVTSKGTDNLHPAWSPDGTTIAFNPNSQKVATVPADGSGAANPTMIPGLLGLPAYQPSNRNQVRRLAGTTRFATAIAVSQALWATADDPADDRLRAKSVVLSRSDNFADALGGGPLAAAKQGPLLLTTPTALDPSTKEEIGRLLGHSPSSTVYLLGGTGAIAQPIEDELKAMGLTVLRLAGPDRFATSVAIAKAITPKPGLVLAATGFNFPDALAAGAAAGSFNAPPATTGAVVLLTADSALPPATKAYLDEVLAADPDARLFSIGGQATEALKPYDPSAVFGNTRYETAFETALAFFPGARNVGVATGSDWPDALSGGALMGTINGPLLLTPTESTRLDSLTALLFDFSSGSIDTGLIFGGTSVVRNTIDAQVGTRISGPGGFDVATKLGTAASGRPDLAAIAKNRKAKQRPSLARLRSLAKRAMSAAQLDGMRVLVDQAGASLAS